MCAIIVIVLHNELCHLEMVHLLQFREQLELESCSIVGYVLVFKYFGVSNPQLHGSENTGCQMDYINSRNCQKDPIDVQD